MCLLELQGLRNLDLSAQYDTGLTTLDSLIQMYDLQTKLCYGQPDGSEYKTV